jgi:hypothetical protein
VTARTDPLIVTWQRNIIWASSIAAAVAAVLMHAYGVETSLRVATALLAVTIGLFWISTVGWLRLVQADLGGTATSPSGETPPPAGTESKPGGPPAQGAARRELSPAMTSGTNLAITVQGFVLGLVFAFLDTQTASATVKVGVASLATGVIVGVLLYSLAAISVPGPRTRALAVILFNVTLWALCYGLLCLVAAVVSL